MTTTRVKLQRQLDELDSKIAHAAQASRMAQERFQKLQRERINVQQQMNEMLRAELAKEQP